jgi:hypothetical protein
LAHSTSSMSSHWVRQHFFLFQRFGDVPDAFVHCRDHPREGAPGRVVDSMQVRLHLDTPATPATWGGGKPNKSQHGHKSMSKYVKICQIPFLPTFDHEHLRQNSGHVSQHSVHNRFKTKSRKQDALTPKDVTLAFP